MAPNDDVPEADRLEQEMPPVKAARGVPRVPPETPDADVLEQALPIVDEGETAGIDAERTEPVSDDDWASTSSV